MYRLALGVILMSFLLIPSGCSTNVKTSENAPIVRVRILESQDQVMVAASGTPMVKSSGEEAGRAVQFSSRAGVPVSLSASGWRVGNITVPGGELLIQPQTAGSVSIGGTAYRGRYRFVPTGTQNKFDVVNDVDIDSYLMSVVSKELLHDWLLETYKAQAIVARTYAMYEAKTVAAGRSFDLYPDVRSQVYGGIPAETSISRQAVMATAGIVVAHGAKGEEKIFKAYFSSCCGGIGQSAYDAFGDADIPPLRAKNAGTICSASPRYNWGPIVFTKPELTRRVKAWATRRNVPLKDIELVSRIDVSPGATATGRPTRFLLTDSKGMQYSLSGEELRWACNAEANGGQTLNSSFVKPISTPDSIQFIEGHGWGHGVGMCQWCAQGMAQRGQRCETIVTSSYPGGVLVRAY